MMETVKQNKREGRKGRRKERDQVREESFVLLPKPKEGSVSRRNESLRKMYR